MKEGIKRKLPEELVSRSQRHPLSTRVRLETYELLEKLSKDLGTSLSDLTAGILDDYVVWYQQEKGIDKKRK